jgi:hypothetical protein
VCLHTLIFTYTLHWVYFRKILKHTPHFAYNNILRNKEISKKKTGQKPQNPAQLFEDESKVTAVQARKMHPGIKVLLPYS